MVQGLGFVCGFRVIVARVWGVELCSDLCCRAL